MSEILVIGREEFVLGFQLTGIRKVIVAEENPRNQIRDLLGSKDISIVLIDQSTLVKLEDHDLFDVESSIAPVFVTISEEGGMGNLRKLIKKSIGVDILQ